MASSDSVHPVRHEAALIPLGSHAGTPPIPLKRPTTVIGSRQDAVRLHLQSSTVSKVHAVIVLNRWGCYIHDLGSRTKTWVNGQEVTETDLADGDLIQIGRFKFKYVAPKNVEPRPADLPLGELSVSTLSDALPLARRVLQIGRRPGSDLEFDESAVSNTHAILFNRDGQWYVRDVSSRTGTWLAGKLIHEALVHEGDEIKIGRAKIQYHSAPAGGTVAVPLADASPPVPAPIDQIPLAAEEFDELDLAVTGEEPPAGNTTDADIEAALGLAPDRPAVPLPIEPGHPAGERSDALASLRRDWRAKTPGELEPLDLEPTPETAEPVAEPPAEAVGKAELPGLKPVDLPGHDLGVGDADHVELDLDETAESVTEQAGPPVAEVPTLDLAAAATDSIDSADSIEPTAPEVPLELDLVELDLDAPSVPEPEGVAGIDTAMLTAEAARTEAAEDIAARSDAPAPVVAVEPSEAQPVAPSPEIVADTPFGRLEVVDDVADDDGAIDLADDHAAPPAPVAGEIAEPRLEPVEDETQAETIDLAVPEAVPPTSATVASEIETEEVVAKAGDLPSAAAEAETSVAGGAPVTLVPEAAIEALAESAVEPAEPRSLEERAAGPADAVEKPAESTPIVVDEAALEERAEAAVDPAEAEAEIEAGLADAASVVGSGDAGGGTYVAGLAEVTIDDTAPPEPVIETPPPPVQAALDEDEITGDLPSAPDDEVEPVVPEAESEPSSPGQAGVVEKAVEIESVPEIDLSAVRFDAEEEDSSADDIESDFVFDAEEPEPVADLNGIDFSRLRLEPERADNADTIDAEMDAAEEPPLVEEDWDANGDDHGVRPLLNLADSTFGDASPEPATPAAERDDGIAVELDAFDVVEESTDEPGRRRNGFHAEMPAAAAPEALHPGPVGQTEEEAFGDVTDEQTIPAPTGGSLSDLMPKHGPLMGGAFGPGQDSQWVLGGSPIMGLTGGNIDADPAEADKARPRADADKADPDKGDADPERRRPLRVGFGHDRPRGGGSPFASGNTQTIADLMSERRSGRGESVDVFASPSPSAAALAEAPSFEEAGDAIELKDLTGEQRELLETAERFRPRGIRPHAELPGQPAAAVPDAAPLSPPAALVAAATPLPHDRLDQLARKRRRHLRTVLLCTLLLPVLIGGAIFAVYYLIPRRASVEATITFRGLDRLGEQEQRNFRGGRNELLASDAVRIEALSGLRPDVSPGFLADRRRLETALGRGEDRWPSARPDAMKLAVLSTDTAADTARLSALASAFLKNNNVTADTYDKVVAEMKRGQSEVLDKQTQLDRIERELQTLNQQRDSRPDGATVDAAALDARRAEQAMKEAIARRQNLEVEIERLKQADTAPVAAAPTPAGPSETDDAELADLNGQLAALRQRNDRIKTDTANRNAAARDALDATITQLQKELETAQKLKDSPELTRYVVAARQFFGQMRKFTDDLMRRQELQHASLSEMKDKAAKMMEEQLKEKLGGDKELKQLNDEYAILLRQHNAATAQGMAEEAKKVDLQMKLLKSIISGKEEVYRKDPIYSELVSDLQRVMEQTKQGIQEDRKNIDQALNQAQADFLKNAPAVEKLPDEQKRLVESIEKRLTEVTQARQQFTATADAAEAEQAAADTQLKDEVAALQLKIHAREREVAAASKAEQLRQAAESRQKDLATKLGELGTLQQAETATKSAYTAAIAKVEGYQALRRQIAETDTRRDEKLIDKQRLESEIRTLLQPIERKQAYLAGLIVPEPKFDIVTIDQDDKRPIFAGGAGGVMFLALLVPIIYNLRLVSRETHQLHPTPVHHGNGFDPILGDEVSTQPVPMSLTQAPEPEPGHAMVPAR